MNPAGSADCNFTRTDFLRVFVIFFVTDERLQSGTSNAPPPFRMRFS
jgi:hypothetical protein